MVVVDILVPTEHVNYVLEELCSIGRVGNDDVGLQHIRSVIN
jgi:hypothetical protein